MPSGTGPAPVRDPPKGPTKWGTPGPSTERQGARRSDRRVDLPRTQGFSASGHVDAMGEGGVAGTLAERARSCDAELIVMGSRGLGHVAGLVGRSVSHALLAGLDLRRRAGARPGAGPAARAPPGAEPLQVHRVLGAGERGAAARAVIGQASERASSGPHHGQSWLATPGRLRTGNGPGSASRDRRSALSVRPASSYAARRSATGHSTRRTSTVIASAASMIV
jgi:hypothetical protein